MVNNLADKIEDSLKKSIDWINSSPNDNVKNNYKELLKILYIELVKYIYNSIDVNIDELKERYSIMIDSYHNRVE